MITVVLMQDSHKSNVLHCVSATAVVGEGPVWLPVCTCHCSNWRP